MQLHLMPAFAVSNIELYLYVGYLVVIYKQVWRNRKNHNCICKSN